MNWAEATLTEAQESSPRGASATLAQVRTLTPHVPWSAFPVPYGLSQLRRQPSPDFTYSSRQCSRNSCAFQNSMRSGLSR